MAPLSQRPFAPAERFGAVASRRRPDGRVRAGNARWGRTAWGGNRPERAALAPSPSGARGAADRRSVGLGAGSVGEVLGERFAGVEEVEVAALHVGLGLQLGG